MASPTAIGLYRETTKTMGARFNDSRKYCPGCKSNRSAAQFKDHPDYCTKCVLRGKVKA